MAKKQKYYVVWQGRKPGIYSDWDECKEQVVGVQGAQYKGFDSMGCRIIVWSPATLEYLENLVLLVFSSSTRTA